MVIYVIVQKELCLLMIFFSKSEKTQNNIYYYCSYFFMVEIPSFALLFQTFEPYCSLLFLWRELESLWAIKPKLKLVIICHKIFK